MAKGYVWHLHKNIPAKKNRKVRKKEKKNQRAGRKTYKTRC